MEHTEKIPCLCYIGNKLVNVRFEVFTAVTKKNDVFWDVALCRSCLNRCRFTQDLQRNVGSHMIYIAPNPKRRHS
jgi:hypothetical protein